MIGTPVSWKLLRWHDPVGLVNNGRSISDIHVYAAIYRIGDSFWFKEKPVAPINRENRLFPAHLFLSSPSFPRFINKIVPSPISENQVTLDFPCTFIFFPPITIYIRLFPISVYYVYSERCRIIFIESIREQFEIRLRKRIIISCVCVCVRARNPFHGPTIVNREINNCSYFTVLSTHLPFIKRARRGASEVNQLNEFVDGPARWTSISSLMARIATMLLRHGQLTP